MMRNDLSNCTACVFTHYHRYSGTVLTKGYRLADLLNEPSTEVVEIHQVRVSQPLNPHSPSVSCPNVLLRKDTILLAMPAGGYEAPARRAYSYVEKRRYHAKIVIPGHTLIGTLHLPSRANPWVLFQKDGPEASFIPITDVNVFFATPNVEPLKTDVIIFRRLAIESIFLAEQDSSKSTLGDLDASELLKRLTEEEARSDSHSEGAGVLPSGLSPLLDLSRLIQ